MLRILLLLMLLSFAVACGGGDNKATNSGGNAATVEDDEEEEEVLGVRKKFTADMGTATVSGAINFDGKVRRRTVDMGSEKYCVNCYKDGEAPKSESVVVGANGELANVFVYVKDGLKGYKFAKGTGEKLIDQIKCVYVPHVTGMQVGDTLKVKNSID